MSRKSIRTSADAMTKFSGGPRGSPGRGVAGGWWRLAAAAVVPGAITVGGPITAGGAADSAGVGDALRTADGAIVVEGVTYDLTGGDIDILGGSVTMTGTATAAKSGSVPTSKNTSTSVVPLLVVTVFM